MLGEFTALGITRESSEDEVKSAYRVLAKKYHPDKGGSKEKFTKLTEQYEKLLASRRITKPRYSFTDHEMPEPYVKVWGWSLNDQGNGQINMSCFGLVCAYTEDKLLGDYYWSLLGRDMGALEIDKKHLAKCNYNVTITFHGFGFREITKTYDFPDNRGLFTKLVDKFRYMW